VPPRGAFRTGSRCPSRGVLAGQRKGDRRWRGACIGGRQVDAPQRARGGDRGLGPRLGPRRVRTAPVAPRELLRKSPCGQQFHGCGISEGSRTGEHWTQRVRVPGSRRNGCCEIKSSSLLGSYFFSSTKHPGGEDDLSLSAHRARLDDAPVHLRPPPQSCTTTRVPGFASVACTPCHPSGSVGPTHPKSSCASCGVMFTHP
jgi:hypothetical protein